MKNMMKITGIASNSLEAIKMLKVSAPDVIILDLVMPRSDGFVLLEYLNIQQFDNRPDVLVLSSLSNDQIIKRACDLGATYYMLKPFSVSDLHERVLNIAEFERSPRDQLIDSYRDAETIDQCLSLLLYDIGVSGKKKGYQYICESVKLIIEQPKLMDSITKELYPIIGKKYHATPVSVERSIRFAINAAWDNKRTSDIDPAADSARPSNGKFISYLASNVLKSTSIAGAEVQRGRTLE